MVIVGIWYKNIYNKFYKITSDAPVPVVERNHRRREN